MTMMGTRKMTAKKSWMKLYTSRLRKQRRSPVCGSGGGDTGSRSGWRYSGGGGAEAGCPREDLPHAMVLLLFQMPAH